ncbi:MAG: hypothetical protein KJ623_04300 [Nanoarchaeota archaeon]|nr:hypothetical protein [Nanoarchaeota archaeon]
MNKKGAELSMNVIIITILVVIVLVIVALFFTGGMASLTKRISGIFGAQLTDVPEMTTRCNSYCLRYQDSGSPTLQNIYQNSFCTDTNDIDINGDGKIGTGETDLTCAGLGIRCEAFTCV